MLLNKYLDGGIHTAIIGQELMQQLKYGAFQTLQNIFLCLTHLTPCKLLGG